MEDLQLFPRFQSLKGKHMLCLDYGEKVTGSATYRVGSDPYPLPYEKIIFKNQDQLIHDISQIIESELIDILIIGVPYLLDGKSSNMTKKILDFIKKCREKIETTEIHPQDETLSTFEAEKRMLNSPRYNFKVDPKAIDCLAASIILEDFIKS